MKLTALAVAAVVAVASVAAADQPTLRGLATPAEAVPEAAKGASTPSEAAKEAGGANHKEQFWGGLGMGGLGWGGLGWGGLGWGRPCGWGGWGCLVHPALLETKNIPRLMGQFTATIKTRLLHFGPMLRHLPSRVALHPRSIGRQPCFRLSASSPYSASNGAGLTSSGVPEPPVHVPVLLHETVSAFSGVAHPRLFVDGTAGFGGHSRALLQRFPDAQLLCVDRDPEVLAIARANLHDFHGRVTFQTGSFADLATHLTASGLSNEVDGILVDLGANSFHFDAARRGFSVLHDGPLDMRFDQRDASRPTAADAVNTLSEVQLAKIFRDFGEERLAKEFAKAIVRQREERGQQFSTTRDLRECIERIANMWRSSPPKGQKALKKRGKIGNTHPATRCFQALRIYVNDELEHVEEGVRQLVTHLAPNGRLVTIAFHSLEDRPIKELFRALDAQGRQEDEDESDDDWEDEDGDDSAEATKKRFRLVRRKATKATAEEIATNSRARSARLRCLERAR